MLIGFSLSFYLFADQIGLCINVTPSLPKGIYQKQQREPVRGDVVGFCLEGDAAALAKERGYLQAGSCSSGLRPMLKKLAGLPGDVVRMDALGLTLLPAAHDAPETDGAWNVVIHERDSLGRCLTSARVDGIIPAGKALVLTEHPGSFDGRYFGFVPLASLTVYEPVFTF